MQLYEEIKIQRKQYKESKCNGFKKKWSGTHSECLSVCPKMQQVGSWIGYKSNNNNNKRYICQGTVCFRSANKTGKEGHFQT